MSREKEKSMSVMFKFNLLAIFDLKRLFFVELRKNSRLLGLFIYIHMYILYKYMYMYMYIYTQKN